MPRSPHPRRAWRRAGTGRGLLLLVPWLAGCEPWTHNSPRPDRLQVQGCEQAVLHVKDCCPEHASYISCNYSLSARNANARLDLTEGQSRCLLKKSCEAIADAVVRDRSLCDFDFPGRSCR